MKRTLRSVGWILVGIALREAVRVVCDALIGRPGRLVDCTRPVAPARRAPGHGPGSPAVRWPWPDDAFELGNESDRRN